MLYRNKLEVIGNVGRIKIDSNNGRKRARVSVAVNEYRRDEETGERNTYTDWIEFTFFAAKAVDFIEKYARKGDHVAIEGKVRQSSYEKNGSTVYTVEIIGFRFTFVEPKGEAESSTGEEGA